ncbi:LeoA/HP0731 family dynamin-like GTPase [uncultured Psychrobacter sp.]|uniref:LeoA/HP0731 family dynamin-like GTPase n=1 Tax=uncultured Psychrobacter sp. TaxID=259303 RepID=UPI00345848D4
MSETLKEYQVQQERVLGLLAKLDGFLKEGSEFGLDLPDAVKDKLSNAINNVKENKLKIALIGGFSEGKTSIAAAWLGKLDKSSMNISAAESSNEVSVYDIGDDCLLIDTPGLYGYKEQENSDFEIEKYKDITKKYVSEAHIVLYVMNSKNPVKESHKDDLTWLFRELNLLSRTVFVLSRFDEVADVEDEDEYQHFLNIKKNNVTERLQDFLKLTSQEVQQLNIVGVSANPFDEGVEYWLDNPEEFSQLSHIGSLQESTKKIVKNNGSMSDIVNNTRKSIFSDIIIREIPKVEQKQEEIAEVINDLEYLWTNKQSELAGLGTQIRSARLNIKDSMKRFFEDVIMQARGVGMDTVADFLDREIGDEGSRIQSSLNSIFQNEIATVSFALDQQIVKFDTELENIDSAVSVMARKGVNHLVKNVKMDNKTVLAARDGVKVMTKYVGLDLSKMLKFKPHGAIKLANNLNSAFAFLGLGMELYDSYKQAEVKEKFETSIKELIDNLKKQEKEILELVDSERFVPMFFQGYIDLENSYKSLQDEISDYKNVSNRFNQWKNKGSTIDAEFREIL